MPAWYARPKEASGPLPVVLVVREIFGMHEHIRDICRRLALEGYQAIAPEPYFREDDPNDYHDIPILFSELVSKVPDTQVLADLDHAANWAARNGGAIRSWALPASAGAGASAGCMPRTIRNCVPRSPGMAACSARKP
nr:carboxymethylenebutenolidase [Candidatus Pantoea persica]